MVFHSVENDRGNALILSLYLFDSEEDIYPSPEAHHEEFWDVRKRASFYQRLCEACHIANDILRSSATACIDDCGPSNVGSQKKQFLPWSCGGDGPLFGVHCDSSNDHVFRGNLVHSFDADDDWQSQYHSDHISDSEYCLKQRERREQLNFFQQPHLKAICRYGNDINDLWRCVSLAFQISSVLSKKSSAAQCSLPSYTNCAIECWDVNDGHILLIEAANFLPSWVDDDVLQGGVGGPEGCKNRCWILNGQVHLIPPSFSTPCIGNEDAVVALSRRDALCSLIKSMNEDSLGSVTAASEHVQNCIRNRIDRTCYLFKRKHTSMDNSMTTSEQNSSRTKSERVNSHWHVAAAALPAAVAYFVQMHPSIVPILVDSFCKHAPNYLRQLLKTKADSVDVSSNEPDEKIDKVQLDSQAIKCESSQLQVSVGNPKSNTATTNLGKHFSYERIVVLPITMTRTNYAELITGRGIVPSFPVPKEYHSVELNRFQRQLRQSVLLKRSLDAHEYDSGHVKNVADAAIDLGLRLCAGLDWVAVNNMEAKTIPDGGNIERRLRTYWTRIDAQVNRNSIKVNAGFVSKSEDNLLNVDTDSLDVQPLSWIEEVWQAGPNRCETLYSGSDEILIQAVKAMSSCPVFKPELSEEPWRVPYPITNPGLSLYSTVQLGMKHALKWQREVFMEDFFPISKLWEADSDSWMDVKSLEELETEMKSLASSSDSVPSRFKGEVKPRRITRRSRRKIHKSEVESDDFVMEEESFPTCDSQNIETIDKMLHGFRTLVEGEGEMDGVIPPSSLPSVSFEKINCIQSGNSMTNSGDYSPEKLMSQDVSINPHTFLNVLHGMMPPKNSHHVNERETEGSALSDEVDVSKFFFRNDLDYCDGSDDSINSNAEILENEEEHSNKGPHDLSECSVSLKNIMQEMDYELQTSIGTDPSIKDLSLESNEWINANQFDYTMLKNLLKSLESEEANSGPVTQMLLSMGICPPR